MEPAKKLVVGRTSIIKGPILGSPKPQAPLLASGSSSSSAAIPPVKPLLTSPPSIPSVPIVKLPTDMNSTPAPAGVTTSGTKPKSKWIDHQIACGVLVGIFEKPGVTVTMESITTQSRESNKPEIRTNWMKDNTICALAKQCLQARNKVPNLSGLLTTAAFLKTSVAGENENESHFAQLRKQMVELLNSKGVTERAKEMGFIVVQ